MSLIRIVILFIVDHVVIDVVAELVVVATRTRIVPSEPIVSWTCRCFHVDLTSQSSTDTILTVIISFTTGTFGRSTHAPVFVIFIVLVAAIKRREFDGASSAELSIIFVTFVVTASKAVHDRVAEADGATEVRVDDHVVKVDQRLGRLAGQSLLFRDENHA